jgi:hypothetical protein
VNSSRAVECWAVAAAAVWFVGCGSGDHQSVGASACGPPTKVSRVLETDLGPIRIPVFAHGAHAETHFKRGYPTRVMLFPTRGWSGDLVLRGSRCSDGRALRFWYQDAKPPSTPLSQKELRRVGTAAGRLPPPPRPLPAVGNWAYSGYMLFSDYGRWRLRAYVKQRLVGAVVVAVTPFPS